MALPSPASPSEIAQKLAELWQRRLPQTLQRLDLLDQAAAAATSGTLTPTLRGEAVSLAHTFAGSLGMFGYEEGTRLARELEQHLQSASPDPTTIAGLTNQLRRCLLPL